MGMKASGAVVAAVLGAACLAGPARWAPWAEPDPGPRVAVVANKGDFLRQSWARTGWYRVNEDATRLYPVHVLVTGDNRACLVSGAHIVEVPIRARYDCESGWRAWRP